MGLFGKSKAEREREQKWADERARLAAHKLRMEQQDEAEYEEVTGAFSRVEQRQPTWNDVSKERGATTVIFETTEGIRGSIGYEHDHYIYLEINQRMGDGKDARIYRKSCKSFYEVQTDIQRYHHQNGKAYCFLRDIITATKEALKREADEKNRELYEQIRREHEDLKAKEDLARRQFFDN
jgi:hypothetical protein